MTEPFRLPDGGRIDRSTAVPFSFDGHDLVGHPGDTLASALLANGVRTVARSVHLGRLRGVYAAGAEEPCALVQVESWPGSAPSRRATQVELYEGLRASGLAGRSALAIDDVIRPAADALSDARYDKAYAHCDVLVVGGGPAGLAAATAAGTTGARVMLLDEQPELGGDLLGARVHLDGEPAMRWVERLATTLDDTPGVEVMLRTTAIGYYDHNYVVAVQRRTEHLGAAAPSNVSRQRLWHIRAKRVVLATGAHERPIVFTDNDRPGVMLASAARTYVNRYAVRPGTCAVVFTNNDSAYAAALDLLDAGADVATVIDVRPELPSRGSDAGQDPIAGPDTSDVRPKPAGRGSDWLAALRDRGVEVLRGHAVAGTEGAGELSAVHIAPVGGGAPRTIECDLLAASGGWNPAVHLFSQSGGRLRYDDGLAAFVPAASAQAVRSTGAAAGVYGTTGAIAAGFAAGVEAAQLCGFEPGPAHPQHVPYEDGRIEEPPTAYWVVPTANRDEHRRQFVDLERDATVADLERATGAGLRSVEHVKRYTTVGTASDQGKTSGVVAVGVISELLGQPPGSTGTTTFRPPYTPVAFELLAGRDRGALADPARVTAIHDWHVANGAVFEDVGQWRRPWFYPRPGEDMTAAVLRECKAARTGVAVMDASTLGKIDIQGPDAAELLDRVYTNRMSTLAIGSCRYGLMCSADGMVLDDGVTARLDEHRFVITTTTGNAATILDWLDEWMQTEWPQLRVHATSVTDHWADVAIVGPSARAVFAALAPDLAVDADAFGFMTMREAMVAGIPARVFRVSFSGELAYEVNVPAWYGLALWEAVMAAGEPYGITPYGTETMHVLRAEKGYPIVGQDTDGTVTPQDLGMGWVVSKKKGDFIGRRSHRRPDTTRADRRQLVGLLTEDPAELLPEGAQLVEASVADGPAVDGPAIHGHASDGHAIDGPVSVAHPTEAATGDADSLLRAGIGARRGQSPVPMVGYVTSSYRSAALDRSIALALVRGGSARMGERLYAPLVDRTVAVTVTSPVFYDPDGSRRDG